MEGLWSPWRVQNRPLQPPYNRAEIIRQKVAIEDLMGTTIHPDFRAILRAVHSDLSLELEGVNGNGRDGYARESKAATAAES